MNQEGPPLDRLTRRLAETPRVFLAEPMTRQRGEVDLGAVATDLLFAIAGELQNQKTADRLRPANSAEHNRARLALICCWLLYDDWFQQHRQGAEAIRALLADGLQAHAALIDAERFVADAERREELVRLVLSLLDLRPAGETPHQAADRLKALDSVERDHVLRAARAREEEEKARRLRQAMEEQRAREAAAKANREW
jgi:hypothetical protein